MTFTESVQTCLTKKYATFTGRAARSEYWWFYLFYIVCIIVASFLDRLLGTSFASHNALTGQPQTSFYGWLYALVAIGFLLPNLGVLVRRLHDRDRSGWWFFIVLIPLVGAIVLLVWLASAGTPGQNRYGFDPLGGDLGTTFS